MVRVCEDVPIETPAGSTVDKTAGEVVPKLMSAADECMAETEPTRLRSTERDSGTPAVVRSEYEAVGAKVSEITPMVVEAAVIAGLEDLDSDEEIDVAEVLEDRSGPRPLEREITDASVGKVLVFLRELDKGLDVEADIEAVVRAVEVPLGIDGNEPVSVDVTPVGVMLSVVRLPTMPGVEPLTTPGVEPSMIPGVEDETIVVEDRDQSGWYSSEARPTRHWISETHREGR